jgi:hypothetical protein
MAHLKLDDMMKAASDEVAIGFIAWLGQGGASSVPEYRALDRGQMVRLLLNTLRFFKTPCADQLSSIFDCRGKEAVERVLRATERSSRFKALLSPTVCYCSPYPRAFAKYRKFWLFLSDGGEIEEPELAQAKSIWAEVNADIAKCEMQASQPKGR